MGGYPPVPTKLAHAQSFPAQPRETADVSLIEETIAVRNYWYLLGSPRNRTQEADGSIPFSSTKLLVFERLASTLSARRRLALSTVSPGRRNWRLASLTNVSASSRVGK